MSKEYTAIQDPQTKSSLVRRLQQKLSLNEVNGCLEWTAKAVHNMGYGKISSTREIGPLRTHRLAWVLQFGEIPDNMVVMHSCDNPKCCNIDHLSLGTKLQNMQDMKQKGRHFTPFSNLKGECNKSSTTTLDVVKKIIIAEDFNKEIAKVFGVTAKVVSDIKLKKSWKYLHEDIPKWSGPN